jgi:hypothetical protein
MGKNIPNDTYMAIKHTKIANSMSFQSRYTIIGIFGITIYAPPPGKPDLKSKSQIKIALRCQIYKLGVYFQRKFWPEYSDESLIKL